jgi:hypothetical protein
VYDEYCASNDAQSLRICAEAAGAVALKAPRSNAVSNTIDTNTDLGAFHGTSVALFLIITKGD